ncbi:MAG: hypothetical protein WEC15_00975 [Flavobacteriales bacterium]
MITHKPFIFYSLPKSRTTQQLHGGRKIELAWENVRRFLTNCTTADPQQPTRISLTAYAEAQGGADNNTSGQLIQELEGLFGKGLTAPISFAYPSGLPSQDTKTKWELDAIDLQKAIDHLIHGQPWPRSSYGPIELVLTFYFNLLDPTTGAEIPGQEQRSSLLVWLSRSCACSPELYFPFERADDKFRMTLEQIKPLLPFDLEEKYLRSGRSNKARTGHTFSKLEWE